jgi:hypothetical protein
MSRLQTRLSIIFAVVLLAACSKTGSPPNTFGVNLTVDGSAVSAADRAKITTGQLHALSDKTGAAVITRTVDGFASAIQGGVARFHYTPGADVAAGDTLTFELDGLDAAGIIIASGTSPKITLTATAVPATIVLAGSSDGGVPPGDGGGGDGNGKGNGTACLTGTECASTFCADGVCCNEKCDDVCVSCNGSPATKGTCTPYAAGTDPEMECAAKIDTTPTPDAGSDAMTTGDGASSDAAAEAAASGDAAAASSDASDGSAAASDAELISEPDGGFMTTPTACAGTCGGARSCKYPDAKTTCGTPFCNTHKDVASFVCDSNGGCTIALGACTDYACDDATHACLTRCSAHSDCQLTDYCDGTTHTCVPKNDLGLACTADANCRSGNCAIPTSATMGVCCNTACNTAPLSCNNSGSVGQCKCAECTTGPCQIFYPDTDGDGYGDVNATYGHGAVAGCMNTPPAHFVADNTDCDDNNINAHPNQTGYFGTPRSNGSFDYNCDGNGTSDFGTPEYPGVACRFCGAPGTCTTSPTLCSSGATESFQCPEENLLIERLAEPISLGGSGALAPRLSSVTPVTPVEPVEPIVPVQPIGRYCCGCRTTDKTGFITAVPCGAYNYVYTCGSCGATAETKGAYTQQTCR